jgi:hypothetical protein
MGQMANGLSTLSKDQVRNEQLEQLLRRLVLGIPMAEWTPRALAIISNSMGWLAARGDRCSSADSRGGSGRGERVRARGGWQRSAKMRRTRNSGDGGGVLRRGKMGGAGEGGKAVQIEADAGMGGADVAAFGASLGRGGPGGASKETRPGRGAGGVLGEESWSEVGVEEVFEYVAAAVAGVAARGSRGSGPGVGVGAEEFRAADMSMMVNGFVKARVVLVGGGRGGGGGAGGNEEGGEREGPRRVSLVDAVLDVLSPVMKRLPCHAYTPQVPGLASRVSRLGLGSRI